jgi:hypothetical protein
MVRPLPRQQVTLARGAKDKEHAMSSKLNTEIAVAGIDIGKNSFHVIGLDKRGAIVLRQKWSRGQVEARLANTPPCLIGMEACVGAHHLSRKLQALGHDARLMPAKYVRPYSKGQKNDFRDAETVDSSFVFDRTRNGIMASWRQPVELAMTAEEIGRLTAIARSEARLHVGWSGRKCCSPTKRNLRSLRRSVGPFDPCTRERTGRGARK